MCVQPPYILCFPLSNRFVNLGFDHYKVEEPETEPVRMQVFTNRIGNTNSNVFTLILSCLKNELYWVCMFFFVLFFCIRKKKKEGKFQST